MNKDVEAMQEVQGDRVLVSWPGNEYVLTIIHHVMVGPAHELRLVNREVRERRPDFKMTQQMADALRKAPKNDQGCKWQLKLKKAPH